MKVVTKFTIEDSIFIAQYINENKNRNNNPWVQFYSYFIYLNCFALSAVLFMFDYNLAGFSIFLSNVFFLIFLRNKINREAYKSYYLELFSDGEYREIEVELFEDGIRCKSIDSKSFFQWSNIKSIAESKEKIFVFTKTMGIPIQKNSFDFESQMQDFLIFAKSRIPQPIIQINDRSL